MKVNRRQTVFLVLCGAVLVPLGLGLMGCRAKPAQWPELGRQNDRGQANSSARNSSRSTAPVPLEILAVSNGGEVANLSSDDIVRIGRRIGLTDREILDVGTDLRNALYLSGGAQVLVRGNVEALLQVRDGRVWIQSVTYGTDVYDLSRRLFRYEEAR